jgi:pilus assembly protein Flp/PilA
MRSEFPGRLRCVTKLKHYSMFRLLENSLGVTAIEYSLIAALIAIAAIAAFTLVGTNLSTVFSTVASQL